jgi:tetratricopeptide (TPR) repeat protein
VPVLLGLADLPAQAKRRADDLRALQRKAEGLQKKGDLTGAARLYERLVERSGEVLGANHPVTAARINHLAYLYKSLGQLRKAEALCRRSLTLLEAKVGKDSLAVATALNNLAHLHHLLGGHSRAEPLYRRSLQIRLARLGKDHPAVAGSLHGLGALCQAMGQAGKAEALLRRSLAILEARRGKDSLEVALVLNSLALLYKTAEQYARAEPLYRRSLEVRQARLGKDHLDVATSLNNLASLYKAMGRYARAEPLYRRSLEARQARLGKDHPSVATALNNLGELYQSMGHAAKAQPLHERSLQIRESALGKDHPAVATALGNLAALHSALGRHSRAVELHDRARRIFRRHAARVLPVLSEHEQADFLGTQVEAPFAAALSLALARRGDPASAARSAAWLLNGKGVAQEALAGAALLARDSNSPPVARLARRLTEVRQELARRTFARSGQERQRLATIRELTATEEDLAKQLRRAGSAVPGADWVELDALRKALPRDGVLIDVARFKVFNPRANPGGPWQPARYAAWVTPPRGEVRLVDLGPADTVDAAVRAVREALDGAPALLKKVGEPAAEKAVRAPLEALAKLVLHPLLPHVGKAKGWLISPDGNLWLVPWAALTLPDGK